jgi:hypothetical protein
MRRFTNLVREGRYRAPAAADLRLGTAIEVDLADVTRVREATASAIGGAGDVRLATCGILWYEHDSQTYNDPAFGGAAGLLPQDLDTAPRGRMVQMLHGKGAKVWLRNTAVNTTEPGLNFSSDRAAVTMVNGLSTPGTIDVGNLLGWDATNNYWAVTTNADEAMLIVTAVDDTGDAPSLDAELLV